MAQPQLGDDDDGTNLELHSSVVPSKELKDFLSKNGSLSAIVRGERDKAKREKTVSTVEAGRRYRRLGREYIAHANTCALKIISLEEMNNTLCSQLASSVVRSESDAKALIDLRNEFETVKGQARIALSNLKRAKEEAEKLNSDLVNTKQECERLARKNESLRGDLLLAQADLEVEIGICNEMKESVKVSESMLRESEESRLDEVRGVNLKNALTGAKLHKVEIEKRKLERKIDRITTPSPSILVSYTPKRRIVGSAESETPKTKRRKRPERAFANLMCRDQKRVRAADAMTALENIVACELDPASGRNSDGSLDLLNLHDGQRKLLSVHFLQLLHVIERNWKDHPFVEALQRWQGGKKRQMTPWETIAVTANIDLSQSTVKKLKKEFLARGVVDPFASTRECEYLRDIIDIGRQMVGTHIECKGRSVPVMGVAPGKICSLLEALCRDLFRNGSLEGDKVRILNIGDGGGGVCKLGFSFADVQNPLSERNLFAYLVFQGSDEWEELRTIVKRWAKSINRIKTLTFDVDGKSHTVSVEWFGGGDCKYLAAVYGLKNASAREPCPFCYTDKAGKMISNRFVDDRARSISGLKLAIPRKCRLTVAPARTLRSYQYDGKYGMKSVKGKPIFHIKVQNCVPPGLHAIQGAFDTLIEGVARRMIISEYLMEKGMKPLTKSLPKTLAGKEKAKAQREASLNKLELALKDMTVSVKLLECKLNGSLAPDTVTKVKLRCSDRCLIANKDNFKDVHKDNRARIKCGLCQNMIHFFCDDVISFSDRELAKEESRDEYTCKDCDQRGIGIEDRLVRMKERVAESKLGKDRLLRKIKRLADHLAILKELKEADGGEPARKLESAVKEAGADRQAWFQKYTGNQVRKVLRAPRDGEKSGAEIICDIFDKDKSPLAPVLLQALTLLGRMQAASVARDLTLAEIEEFKRDKDLFFRCLVTLEPNCTMRLKLHILDRHVYPFMLKHRTWGRFLEQAIESKHANWNKKARVYCSSKKQLFVHWKTIMSDMFIQLLFHLNPVRDFTQQVDEYKKIRKAKGKWSDHHGDRVVRAVRLPDMSEDESDVDYDGETPIYDEFEAVLHRPRQEDEEMEIDQE